MSDHTIVNLRDVEDMAPRFGLSGGLESRFARVPLELQNSGVSLFRIAPDFRIPFGHRHGEQEEVYVLVSGGARIRLDDEVVELRPWDAIRVPGPTMRCIEAGAAGAAGIALGPAGGGGGGV